MIGCPRPVAKQWATELHSWGYFDVVVAGGKSAEEGDTRARSWVKEPWRAVDVQPMTGRSESRESTGGLR